MFMHTHTHTLIHVYLRWWYDGMHGQTLQRSSFHHTFFFSSSRRRCMPYTSYIRIYLYVCMVLHILSHSTSPSYRNKSHPSMREYLLRSYYTCLASSLTRLTSNIPRLTKLTSLFSLFCDFYLSLSLFPLSQ